ncbi:MAG: peptide chain release factor 1 [Pseudomonadota bacterium]
MRDKLDGIESRFDDIERELSVPDVFQDRERYERLSREHSELAKIVAVYRDYRKIQDDLESSRELLKDGDAEIKELAREEVDLLTVDLERLDDALRKLLIPKDPLDHKNVILEIRAGTGGDEAALFSADLFRMYSRYAEQLDWKVEPLTFHATGSGGLKEIIALIGGKGAYSRLKFESGTHRVQRVPATEAQGRIHTSAVTVAVLPEAEEVDFEIDPNDLKFDVFRSSGPGGQSVNTTDSAVRVTHLPSGLVVICQDEKSQHKNKAKALKVLRSRLLDAMIQEQNDKRSAERKNQIGSGDRSGRIRTYNFPQGRVTDHRIGLTLYKLDAIMEGDMTELLDEVITAFQAKALGDADIS